MKCPRCKCDDVFLSRSGNAGVISFLMNAVRCHRCCHLFSVPRWTHVPKKPEQSPNQQDIDRSAAWQPAEK